MAGDAYDTALNQWRLLVRSSALAFISGRHTMILRDGASMACRGDSPPMMRRRSAQKSGGNQEAIVREAAIARLINASRSSKIAGDLPAAWLISLSARRCLQ